jgi:hypothetical protein
MPALARGRKKFRCCPLGRRWTKLDGGNRGKYRGGWQSLMGYGDLKDRVRTGEGESIATLEFRIVHRSSCGSEREHFRRRIKHEMT